MKTHNLTLIVLIAIFSLLTACTKKEEAKPYLDVQDFKVGNKLAQEASYAMMGVGTGLQMVCKGEKDADAEDRLRRVVQHGNDPAVDKMVEGKEYSESLKILYGHFSGQLKAHVARCKATLKMLEAQPTTPENTLLIEALNNDLGFLEGHLAGYPHEEWKCLVK